MLSKCSEVRDDLFDFEGVTRELQGYDAYYFYLGVSTTEKKACDA